MSPRLAAAIPWRPEKKEVSRPIYIKLGQRVSLTHTLWNVGDGQETQRPYTSFTTLTHRELVTWPPGVAPEPNCATKIYCKIGSDHLPIGCIL